MTYPNRLVKVSDIGALTEQIAQLRWSGESNSLELPRKQQNAQRVRLAGAVSLPEVKAADSGLEIYWRGGDGRDYQATLVGLDSKRGYAVVTQVTSEWKKDPYRAWRAENGPWF